MLNPIRRYPFVSESTKRILRAERLRPRKLAGAIILTAILFAGAVLGGTFLAWAFIKGCGPGTAEKSSVSHLTSVKSPGILSPGSARGRSKSDKGV